MNISFSGYCYEGSVFIGNGVKVDIHEINEAYTCWQINVGGENDPVMDYIQIKGPCKNYKLITGGIDFTSPKTVVESLLKLPITDSEKVSKIYHFVTQNFYNMS